MTYLSHAAERPASWPLLLGLCLLSWLFGLALSLPCGVERAVHHWEEQLNDQVVIALPATGNEPSGQTNKLSQALTATFPKAHTTLLPDRDVTRILASWSTPWDGPLPRLFTLSYHGEMSTLTTLVHNITPEAIIVPPPPQMAKLAPLMAALRKAASHVALAAGLAAALVIPALLYLAARTIALANRQQQAVLLSLGRAVTTLHHILARRMALTAFLGGLAGIILLLPSLMLITSALRPLLRLPATTGLFPTVPPQSFLPPMLWGTFCLMPFLMALAGWGMTYLVCAKQGRHPS